MHTLLYLSDYRCGFPGNWSEVKSLKPLDSSETGSLTFAVYGDLGWENAQSVPYLKRDVEYGLIDGVLHCGDIGYDLYEVSYVGVKNKYFLGDDPESFQGGWIISTKLYWCMVGGGGYSHTFHTVPALSG